MLEALRTRRGTGWAVHGLAPGRFGHGNTRDPRVRGERRVQQACQLLGDVPGDVFGRGIEGDERLHTVQIGVLEGLDHLFEHGFDGVKITQQPVWIELGALDNHFDAPVVAMDCLAEPRDHQGVRGTELALDGELEHKGV